MSDFIAWLKSLFLKSTGQWEVYEVVPGLWQGSAFTPDDMPRILSMGIRLIIDLAGSIDQVPQGIQLIHWPIADSNQLPDVKRLHEIAEYASLSYLAKGKNVLSHCSLGKNRSGLMNAVILMHYLGITGEQALELVQRKVPGSLFNPVFAEYLEGL